MDPMSTGCDYDLWNNLFSSQETPSPGDDREVASHSEAGCISAIVGRALFPPPNPLAIFSNQPLETYMGHHSTLANHSQARCISAIVGPALFPPPNPLAIFSNQPLETSMGHHSTLANHSEAGCISAILKAPLNLSSNPPVIFPNEPLDRSPSTPYLPQQDIPLSEYVRHLAMLNPTTKVPTLNRSSADQGMGPLHVLQAESRPGCGLEGGNKSAFFTQADDSMVENGLGHLDIPEFLPLHQIHNSTQWSMSEDEGILDLHGDQNLSDDLEIWEKSSKVHCLQDQVPTLNRSSADQGMGPLQVLQAESRPGCGLEGGNKSAFLTEAHDRMVENDLGDPHIPEFLPLHQIHNGTQWSMSEDQEILNLQGDHNLSNYLEIWEKSAEGHCLQDRVPTLNRSSAEQGMVSLHVLQAESRPGCGLEGGNKSAFPTEADNRMVENDFGHPLIPEFGPLHQIHNSTQWSMSEDEGISNPQGDQNLRVNLGICGKPAEVLCLPDRVPTLDRSAVDQGMGPLQVLQAESRPGCSSGGGDKSAPDNLQAQASLGGGFKVLDILGIGCRQGLVLNNSLGKHLEGEDLSPVHARSFLFVEKRLSKADVGIDITGITLPKRQVEARFPQMSDNEGYELELYDEEGEGRTWKMTLKAFNLSQGRGYKLIRSNSFVKIRQIQKDDWLRIFIEEPGCRYILKVERRLPQYLPPQNSHNWNMIIRKRLSKTDVKLGPESLGMYTLGRKEIMKNFPNLGEQGAIGLTLYDWDAQKSWFMHLRSILHPSGPIFKLQGTREFSLFHSMKEGDWVHIYQSYSPTLSYGIKASKTPLD